MERSAWTDERLDDLITGMREGFVRVDTDMRDLRAEMRDGFKELRLEIAELRQTMIRFGGGMLIGMVAGFISVLAAIFARGA